MVDLLLVCVSIGFNYPPFAISAIISKALEMSIPTSVAAYRDCYDAMDKALKGAGGIRIEMVSIDQATYYRMRMHQARSLDRKKNREIYDDPAHPMYNASAYDELVLRIRADDEGRVWLYMQKQMVVPGLIEELPDDGLALPVPDRTEVVEFEEVRQIESPDVIKRRV